MWISSYYEHKLDELRDRIGKNTRSLKNANDLEKRIKKIIFKKKIQQFFHPIWFVFSFSCMLRQERFNDTHDDSGFGETPSM